MNGLRSTVREYIYDIFLYMFVLLASAGSDDCQNTFNHGTEPPNAEIRPCDELEIHPAV